MDQSALEELLARLAPLGELGARRMFGGVGLYCDGVFFGLIDGGVPFFRVDEGSREAYRAAGSAPFQPFADKPSMENYYEVPLGVLEREQALLEWARRALSAARARDASKTPGRRGKRAKTRSTRAVPADVPVAKLLNLGPKSAGWLRAVGIRTRADLERVGAVEAYRRVVEAGHETSLNLLYALEGALLDLRWDRLPDVVKRNLRERVGRPS